MQGSEARRLAVSALGESIAAQLRQHNVLPTAVLVAGAVEAATAGLPSGPAGGAGDGAAAEAGVSMAALQAAADWLSAELELRGAAVMRPGSAQ